MENNVKLETLGKDIAANPLRWHKLILQAWQQGKRAGYGFPIGNDNDQPWEALMKEEYQLILCNSDFAVGSDYLSGIIAVVDQYGPWAVDITEEAVKYYLANLTGSNLVKYHNPVRLPLQKCAF